MANQWEVIGGTLSSSFGMLGNFIWVAWLLLALVIIFVPIILFVMWRRSRDNWNQIIRVRQEDTMTKRLYLDPVPVKAKRVTLSNGLRLLYLEKPILGKRLFPMLNFYTKPGVYDLIVTADNRIFLISGIKGIDEQRKELEVGIRYPGIDYSLDEVNRDHAKLNQQDRRSDLLGIVKAASIAVIAIVIMVIFIVGVQKYIEGKQIDASIAGSELAIYESLQQYQVAQNEQTNAMIILIDQLKEVIGEDNLRARLNRINNSG